MSTEIRRLLERAREATGTLRDAAREGRVIEFRQRDPLVSAIHRAFDELEALLASPRPPTEDVCICEIDRHDFNCPVHNVTRAATEAQKDDQP